MECTTPARLLVGRDVNFRVSEVAFVVLLSVVRGRQCENARGRRRDDNARNGECNAREHCKNDATNGSARGQCERTLRENTLRETSDIVEHIGCVIDLLDLGQ
jgi:hypothetical protein